MSVWRFEPSMDLDRAPYYIEYQGALRLPGRWFACEHPERPWDPQATILHDCCRPCLVSAEATVARGDEVQWIDLMRGRLAEYGPAPRLEVAG